MGSGWGEIICAASEPLDWEESMMGSLNHGALSFEEDDGELLDTSWLWVLGFSVTLDWFLRWK